MQAVRSFLFVAFLLVIASGCSPKGNDLVTAACLGDSNRVIRLIASGVPVDSIEKGGIGQTPLAGASGYGNLDMVKLLLKSGADPNLASGFHGTTPIIEAISSSKVNLEVVRFLLDAGADPNKADLDGNKPLDYLPAAKKDVIDLLVSKGAVHRIADPRNLKILESTNYIAIPFKVEGQKAK